MKKVVSTLAISALLLAAAPSTFALEDNPFDDFSKAEIIKTDAPAPEGSLDVKDDVNSETSIPLTTDVSESDGVVTYKVSLNGESSEIKSANVVINFPDVVETSVDMIENGELLDTIDTEKTKVDGTTVTYSASNLTAVPASGELFTVKFKVKQGTEEQEYPFSVDVTETKIVNNLNEDVEISASGVDMVKLKSATVEVKEVQKETGFAESFTVLLGILLTSSAFIASRRKRI